jgi:hypothetical protein
MRTQPEGPIRGFYNMGALVLKFSCPDGIEHWYSLSNANLRTCQLALLPLKKHDDIIECLQAAEVGHIVLRTNRPNVAQH